MGGEGGKWQEKTLERYRELYPEGAIDREKWDQTVFLVRDELRYARLDTYKAKAELADDDKRYQKLSDIQRPIKERISAILEPKSKNTEVSPNTEKIESIRANGETRGEDESNRDAILVNTEKNVYGVFDGVGHERGSAEAATRASEFIGEKISSDAKYSSVEEVQDDLKRVLEDVDRELGDIGSTTASVAKIWKQGDEMFLVWANVGDSRVYLLRDEEPNHQLIQISTDDSGTNNALENKQITQQQAEKIDQATRKSVLTKEELALFNDRNVIWDSLGGGGQATIKSGDIRLKQGDRVALTTDGIHDNLTNADIVNSLITQQPEINLIESAHSYAVQGYDRSKRDDMSAVVIEFPPFKDHFVDFPDVEN